jgi:hypothetical protein
MSCANGASGDNLDISTVSMSDTAVYPSADYERWCHQKCQDSATCQMYSTDSAVACKLYSGSCSPTTSAGTTIYAKSGFIDQPKLVTSRCTHAQSF